MSFPAAKPRAHFRAVSLLSFSQKDLSHSENWQGDNIFQQVGVKSKQVFIIAPIQEGLESTSVTLDSHTPSGSSVMYADMWVKQVQIT